MLAGIKIKPCIPSHFFFFSNNPCLNKLPQPGKVSYRAFSWHVWQREKRRAGEQGWGMGKVLLCFAGWDCHRNKFQEELLFNSSSSAQRAQLWEPHLHAYGYLIGSVQRYSRSQSDWIWCAYKWSSQSGVWCFRRDRENMLSLLHPKSNRNLGILFFLTGLR